MTITPEAQATIDRQRLTADGLHDYLGEFYDDYTDEQRERILTADELLWERYPVNADGTDDFANERQTALSAVLATIDGTPIEEAVSAYTRLALATQEQHAALTGAIIADPRGDTELARAAGLARGTIRKARNKK